MQSSTITASKRSRSWLSSATCTAPSAGSVDTRWMRPYWAAPVPLLPLPAPPLPQAWRHRHAASTPCRYESIPWCAFPGCLPAIDARRARGEVPIWAAPTPRWHGRLAWPARLALRDAIGGVAPMSAGDLVQEVFVVWVQRRRRGAARHHCSGLRAPDASRRLCSMRVLAVALLLSAVLAAQARK